jgi:hypothetical protein
MSDYQFNPNVEQWKEIPGYSGYEVSDHGRVRSFWTNGRYSHISPHFRILNHQVNSKGYHVLSLGNKARTKRVHRFVLLAFVGPCPDKCECRHLDGNPKNNHLPNLRWDTRSNNLLDKRKHGTLNSWDRHGIKNPRCKLSNANVIKIRAMHQLGHSQRELSDIFSVSKSLIQLIVRQKIWTHLI